jgi:hypothetical protein
VDTDVYPQPPIPRKLGMRGERLVQTGRAAGRQPQPSTARMRVVLLVHSVSTSQVL